MVKKEEAKKYLSGCMPEQCFWVNNGPILKSIEELANALPQMSNETFRHHVNGERNDFSNWIRQVIGDKKLAEELTKSSSKDSALKKLKARLNSLKKMAG